MAENKKEIEKLEEDELRIIAKAKPIYPDDRQKLYNRLREAGLYSIDILEY